MADPHAHATEMAPDAARMPPVRVQTPHGGFVPRARQSGAFFAAAPAEASVDDGLWGEPVADPPPIVEGFLDEPSSEPQAKPEPAPPPEPDLRAEPDPAAALVRRPVRRGFLGPPTPETPRRQLPPTSPAPEPPAPARVEVAEFEAAPTPSPASEPVPAELAASLAPEPAPAEPPATLRHTPSASAQADPTVPWWRAPPPVPQPAPEVEAEEAEPPFTAVSAEPLAAEPLSEHEAAPFVEPDVETVQVPKPTLAERWSTVAGSIRTRWPRPTLPQPAWVPQWRLIGAAAAALVVVVGVVIVGVRLFPHDRPASSPEPAVAAAVPPPVSTPTPTQTAASAPPAAPAKPLAVPNDAAERAQSYLVRAKAGDPDSELQVAILYAKGEGVAQDYAEAAKWFRAAAALGVVRAQYDIGVLSERGRGIPVNYEDAFKWYSKASEANFALAQYNLAVAYTRGQGIQQDFVAAAKWYQRSALQGVVPAMVNLAILYERGQGVTASAIDAYAWYRAAGERGNHPAAQRAAELYDVLSIADRTRAETRSATILAQLPAPEPTPTLKSGLESDGVVPASTAGKPATATH